MMNHMVAEGFVAPGRRDSVWFGDAIDELFDWMDRYHIGVAPSGIDTSSIKA
jgi:hypothetical protein